MLKLKPSFKDYLWGGHRLVEEYGKEYDGDILAESWELSCHPDGPSYIVNGEYAGKTLQEYIELAGKGVLGENCRRFREFPILTKFIDARDKLSIQVHPDNRYALKNENQYGKTEMWYVVDAGEGAYLYYGFKDEISREEFAKRIEEDTLLEVLDAVPVKKGDVLFIESGTIHAICENILIAEIQQNSNVTYRVYDFGRVGKDGKKRELHVAKALDVTRRAPAPVYSAGEHVADCDYFTVDKLTLDGVEKKNYKGFVSGASFTSILMLDGCGTIRNGGETLEYKKGDSLFLEAGSGEFEIVGSCDALVTTIRKKEGLVRIGIDIGGTSTKIGIVDEQNRLLAKTMIDTDAMRPAEEVIADIGKSVRAFLEQEGVDLDCCAGVGVGMPGTVDSKNKIVRYSNNIPWKNVPLAEELGKYLPVPIELANDADCAALGEVVAGAGRGCKNAVMVTLGTGVGGGVVMDGKIFSGTKNGGSELGHMVILDGGEPCTCGRRGCWESYASATGLIREAKKATGVHRNPKEIFDGAAAGDEILKEVVETYLHRLGVGIVNIVNTFRPERILLGGGICAQGEVLLKPVREQMERECFGGEAGELPELRISELGNDAGMIGAANLV